jgi:hypothetical protein
MAKGRESFDRRQRERAKKAKADAKRQRRFTKDEESDEEAEPESPSRPVDEEAVLGALAKLHEAYEQERIGFEEFEEQRTELLARLQIN